MTTTIRKTFSHAFATGLLAGLATVLPAQVFAHPHVFIDTKIEVERNDANEAVAVTYNWVFDELFSASIMVDFDDDGDGKISADELKTVSSTILTNIKEYEYFTAFRKGTEVLGVGTPKDAVAILDDKKLLHLTLTVPLEKPVTTNDNDFRISVSDESFYVAFDYTEMDVTFKGGTNKCTNKISVPDFDKLNSEAVNAAFSEEMEKPEFSDEYFTWINVSCS